MKTQKLRKNPAFKPVLLLACLALPLSPALADDDDEDEEGEQHETLFLIEEAYTQEEGEWQIGFALEQSLDGESEREWELEIEYGLTERLQAEVEIEIEEEDGETEVEDIGIGLAFALVEEEAGSRPEITMGGSVLIPSGSDGDERSRGIGYSANLRASHVLRDGLYGHLAIGFTQSPDRVIAGETVEASNWSLGAGIAQELGDEVFLVGEYRFDSDRSAVGPLSETDDTHTASLGVHMEPAEEFVIGAATSIAFGEDTQVALIVTAQIEF